MFLRQIDTNILWVWINNQMNFSQPHPSFSACIIFIDLYKLLLMCFSRTTVNDCMSLWIISSLGLNPEYFLHSMQTCEWQLLKWKIPTGITQLWVVPTFLHSCWNNVNGHWILNVLHTLYSLNIFYCPKTWQ